MRRPVITRAALSAVAIALLAVALPACRRGPGDVAPAATATTDVVPPGRLALGSVSLTPAREYSIFKPFADALAARLHAAGIGTGEVVLVGSVGEMADRLRTGAVDLYLDSPVPVARACEMAAAVPVLRRWKHGVAQYHGVLVVRRDSGIRSLTDLRGRMVAFSEPFSTSGYLLPKATLISRGLKLDAFEDAAAQVPPDRVGYVLSGDAENTMVWVLKGKVAAGALNGDYLDVLAGERRGELEVVMRTIDVPRNVVCRRGDLDPALSRTVEEVLLSMNQTPEGRGVLEAFEGTTKFDRFPEGAERALEPLDQLLRLLEPDEEAMR